MQKILVRPLLIFILALTVLTSSGQWLKASGKKIIDQSGNEVILKGMGLGGWMLQEPYMMEMSGFATTQWQIKAKIQALIGAAGTTAFYDAWHANHCTKSDIDSLAAWGFNSVRLPMHYNLFTLPIEQEPVAGANTWIDQGFTLTDSLIKWCAARHMYVILDLHAAPGGQGRDLAICDGDASKPSLWESDANRQKTIALWTKLATRYANEPWVGGYDLLNEPNWSFTTGGNQNGCTETNNTPLRQIYVDLTAAIRAVDTKHIIIIEGNCWGNNYSGFMPVWDNNMVVSFHKYWSYNDLGSIQGMLDIRSQYNIPLWMGESGENSNTWFTDAIRLVEQNNIGWCWWPLKKINSVVGPMTIKKTTGYQTLLDYWNNGGTVPTSAFATFALMQMAANARNENCSFHKDVTDAMFRQIHDTTTRPWTSSHIPGIIHATDFDLGRCGNAYWDSDTANYQTSSGTYTTWNTGWQYRNDGVDIETTSDTQAASNGFDVGWVADNEWMQYTTSVDSTAGYNVRIRYAAAAAGSKIRLKCNDADICSITAPPASGGFQSWNYATVNDVILYKGIQKLKVVFEKAGLNLGFLEFTLSKNLAGIPLKPLLAETYLKTEEIVANFNKILVDSTVTPAGFTCTVNGQAAAITSFALNNGNPFQVMLNLARTITDQDTILLNYSGNHVIATDGTVLGNFTNFPVQNNLPFHLHIPGKIEAEAFTVNQGLQLETCTDTGGGQDVGFTDPGDYLTYLVLVAKTSIYKFEIRSACQSTAGIIAVEQIDLAGQVINSVTVNIPVTGGWQTWTTVSADLPLTIGVSVLRIRIIKKEFNMNWYRFTDKSQGIYEIGPGAVKIFPNPVTDELTIEMAGPEGLSRRLSIRAMSGMKVMEKELPSTGSSQKISLGHLPKGFYILELEISGITSRTKLVIQ